MKAAQINDYGGQAVLKTVETQKPTAAEDEVLVEVAAAAVNPFDWKLREGYMKDSIKLELPATLGGDVAGTVVEVGTSVSGFDVGQAVFGMANAAGGRGSLAEFTAVRAGQLAAKPTSLDFVAAAALPLAATSAWQALVDHLQLHAGQTILIHGGAGGIGSFAIQIAKHLGARIATTAATDDQEFVKSLGADQAIDYKSQAFQTIIKAYDAVFDTVGGETNLKSYEVLKPGGKLVSMVEPVNQDLASKYQIEYFHQASRVTGERLTKIAELVDAGRLRVNVDRVFPLDQASQALEYLKTGHPKGKVVIQVEA